MADEKPIDIVTLVPELAEWNNGRGISIENWVGCMGSFELAVGYSRLFWPDFVEYEECVFFADFSVESYQSFRQACGADRRRLEAVMNHRHVFDYFSHSAGTATDTQIIYLGRVLKDIWATKLARDFPER